jgi:hypothetical protein
VAKFYDLLKTTTSPDIADYLDLEGRRAINFAGFLNRLSERIGSKRQITLVGELKRVGIPSEHAWVELKTQINEVVFSIAERVCEGDLSPEAISKAIADASGYSPEDYASTAEFVANLWGEVERLKQDYASLPPRVRHGLVRGWVFYDERTHYWRAITELDELEFISNRLLVYLRRAVERELALKDLADGRHRKLKHANAKIEKRIRALLMMGNLWQAYEDVRWGGDYVLENGKRVFKPVRAEIAREFLLVREIQPKDSDAQPEIIFKVRYCYNRTRTRNLIRTAIRASKLRARKYEKAFLRRAN